MIEINRNPTAKQLQQFAMAWLIFVILVGGWMLHGHDWPVIGMSAWLVLIALGLPGLTFPQTVRPIYLLLTYATFPIGFVVSRVILAAVYYGVFTPIGLVMRLAGRDPLQRRWEPDRDSYWEPRTETKEITRYFRQF